jgi:hypothetical protein
LRRLRWFIGMYILLVQSIFRSRAAGYYFSASPGF